MIECTRSLIVIHRKESASDFEEIGRRIRELDPTIAVAMISEFLDPGARPNSFFQRPLLAVYLVNPPPKDFKHSAGKLAVEQMTKLEEYEYFKTHKIPCLPIEEFNWGMELDSAIYGDWVVLKPKIIQSSGQHVNMLPIDAIPHLKPDDFPEDHYIHQDQYYVQQLLKTGTRPFHYRSMIFLGEILYSATNESFISYPSPTTNIETLLKTSIASNNHHNRERKIVIDERKNKFALEVAKEFSNHPILGIDIIEDLETKKLYVLEINAGGNGWHFSSAAAANIPGHEAQRSELLEQYHAFDTAAEALVRKTHELAR